MDSTRRHSFDSYIQQRVLAARHADRIDVGGERPAAILCPGVGSYHGGMAKDQIEDQVRCIKRLAPEMPGISFYGGDDAWCAALGDLPAFLDDLCLRYYIMRW